MHTHSTAPANEAGSTSKIEFLESQLFHHTAFNYFHIIKSVGIQSFFRRKDAGLQHDNESHCSASIKKTPQL
jgi:hypothetical protein